MSDLILYEKNLFGRIIIMTTKEEKTYQNQIQFIYSFQIIKQSTKLMEKIHKLKRYYSEFDCVEVYKSHKSQYILLLYIMQYNYHLISVNLILTKFSFQRYQNINHALSTFIKVFNSKNEFIIWYKFHKKNNCIKEYFF